MHLTKSRFAKFRFLIQGNAKVISNFYCKSFRKQRIHKHTYISLMFKKRRSI